MAASNNKVKGLFKGLRYISQIFDDEKEEEMEIGNPTDVKHVAHIGWDGPSVNSPSWMNEFKPSDGTGYSSAPVETNGDVHQITEADSAIKLGSEDRRGRRSSKSGNLEMPELPKSSRSQSSVDLTDPATSEKAEKHNRHRKSSRHKNSSDGSRSIRLDAGDGSESPATNLSDVPKKNRRKKSKDVSGGGSGSTRSRLKSKNSDLDLGSPSGSVTKSKERTFDEDAESEKG